MAKRVLGLVELIDRRNRQAIQVARTGERFTSDVLALSLTVAEIVDLKQRQHDNTQGKYSRKKEWLFQQDEIRYELSIQKLVPPITFSSQGKAVVEGLREIGRPDEYKGMQWSSLLHMVPLLLKLNKHESIRYVEGSTTTLLKGLDKIQEVIDAARTLPSPDFIKRYKLPQTAMTEERHQSAIDRAVQKITETTGEWNRYCQSIANRSDKLTMLESLASAVGMSVVEKVKVRKPRSRKPKAKPFQVETPVLDAAIDETASAGANRLTGLLEPSQS